jgi:hypothetical protein
VLPSYSHLPEDGIDRIGILRSSSAMRAFGLASSSALGVADGSASAADAGSDDAPSAEGKPPPDLASALAIEAFGHPIARFAAR